MANVTLLGADYADVPSILLPKTGGGNASFLDAETAQDMTADFAWLGLHPELVDEFYNESYALADTTYATWTPSTTARSLVATKNVDTFKADLANYEYWILWDWDYTGAFNEGATMKSQIERQCGILWQNIHRRPYGFANFDTNTDSYNYCTSVFSGSSYCIYYSTSGTRTWTAGISYGFYAAAQGATFNSASSLTPTVTRKSPVLNCRCNNSYLSTARAAEIDQAAATFKVRGRMYRVAQNTSDARHFYKEAIELYNNPL